MNLIIIDPQVDFCDSKGALYVKNAEKDMQRIASMIQKNIDKICNIYVTLDTHQFYDISHNVSYINRKGENPPPFTILTKEQIINEEWIPTGRGIQLFNDLFKKTVIQYITELENKNKDPLCLWPPHCLIGTYGHSVFPILMQTLQEWMIYNKKNVRYLRKGENTFTEHYSAIKAEVPDPNDKKTELNEDFIFNIEIGDLIVICGEAGSHCVKATVEDIVDGFSIPEYIEKTILIEDGMSPVPGFENKQNEFIKNMKEKGMQSMKAADI